MPKFKTRPAEVIAEQFNVANYVTDAMSKYGIQTVDLKGPPWLAYVMPSGKQIKHGDWIVTHSNGEISVVDDFTFKRAYEPATPNYALITITK